MDPPSGSGFSPPIGDLPRGSGAFPPTVDTPSEKGLSNPGDYDDLGRKVRGEDETQDGGGAHYPPGCVEWTLATIVSEFCEFMAGKA